MARVYLVVVMMVLVPGSLAFAEAPTKKMKVFVLAGQSNMVGYGDSTELPDDLRKGNDRVLMFEDGKWQPPCHSSTVQVGSKVSPMISAISRNRRICLPVVPVLGLC